jgi:glutamate synthase (NADPH/NADH) large chain
MSGGEAYVLDEAGTFDQKVNRGMVRVEPLTDDRDRQLVRRLVDMHRHHTGSTKAERVLANWDQAVNQFRKVMPEAFARQVEEHLQEGEDIRPPVPPSPEDRAPVVA